MIPTNLNQTLVHVFSSIEDKAHTKFPTLRPHLLIFLERDYKGNLELRYSIYDMGTPGAYQNPTQGRDLGAVLTEWLRRQGWEEEQAKLALEAPPVEGR